ncbi:primosomal protein N' [Legionella impletisoli]|uniref:Replication restart protein PriA n=1 Tax=Legionella impletisoli TaxID=343510 RepID=A0A917JWY6_9GAMM|nr:primosomal protein N' [Legionella impletisoli]GGI86753.1 primosomal protein N' [Legionella impletisoli]
MGQVAQVCIPHTNRDFFDYHCLEECPALGARVLVPFRNKQRLGVVVGHHLKESSIIKTKAIDAVLDKEALIPSDLLSLCRWVADYYQSPLSEVLPLMLPKRYREGKAESLSTKAFYSLAMSQSTAHQTLRANAPKQHALIDFLATSPNAVDKQTLLNNGFITTQIHALLERGILVKEERVAFPYVPNLTSTSILELNNAQKTAVDAILASFNRFQCFLLQGVTGSGKTEVYLRVIERALSCNQQVLVLVPEIGLTPQLLARFYARLNEPMVVIHSNLNDTERQHAWQLAHQGLAKLVIGTRTAVFTPIPKLGLIIIDEEHDSSLKQMDGVRYSARDTALIRARDNQIPIVLGSATPSLESLHNCLNQKYKRLLLPNRAAATTPLEFQIMDIRSKLLHHGLSEATLEQIQSHLNQGNQVLVFINRRGYAPVLLCHQCGFMADCRACDSHLTLHQTTQQLICHHCGLAQPIPKCCKACKSSELIPVGVGTQRIFDYLSQRFPNTTLLRVDRDEVRRKHALHDCLAQINQGDAQLIVGTQMLAKGHHFPNLTLVVILDADQGFYNQDFRALERLGQLITQVAGRAGREDKPGKVLIQTHLPHHPLLNCLIQEGYDAFAETLLEQRRLASLPPYQFLALIRAQSKTLPSVLEFLHKAKFKLQDSRLLTLGPAPAPLARKSDYHRMQLLIKSPSRKALQTTLTELRSWLTINNKNNRVRWNIDVDPMDLS